MRIILFTIVLLGLVGFAQKLPNWMDVIPLEIDFSEESTCVYVLPDGIGRQADCHKRLEQ